MAVQDAVENRGLITSDDDVLLELLCAFDVIRLLRESGWNSIDRPVLIGPGRKQPVLFTGTRSGYVLELTYQATPPDLSRGSLYGDVQKAHKFTRASGLRPDLVIRVRKGKSTVG